MLCKGGAEESEQGRRLLVHMCDLTSCCCMLLGGTGRAGWRARTHKCDGWQSVVLQGDEGMQAHASRDGHEHAHAAPWGASARAPLLIQRNGSLRQLYAQNPPLLLLLLLQHPAVRLRGSAALLQLCLAAAWGGGRRWWGWDRWRDERRRRTMGEFWNQGGGGWSSSGETKDATNPDLPCQGNARYYGIAPKDSSLLWIPARENSQCGDGSLFIWRAKRPAARTAPASASWRWVVHVTAPKLEWFSEGIPLHHSK